VVAVLEQRENFDQATADRDFAAIDPSKWQRKR
jgi:hypothetical protein